MVGGLPLITYALRGGEGGQVSHTFPLRITKKKGGGGGGPGTQMPLSVQS